MRGNEAPQVHLFSYVHLEDRIPLRHPLRPVRRMVDQALAGLDGAFGTMYATTGRPSIPPERLLRALLLQIFYSTRGVASQKRFQRKDGSSPPPAPGRSGEADFHGQRRTNETHQSSPRWSPVGFPT